MPHSDFLAWLSSATLKIFISGVSSRILIQYKVNLVLSSRENEDGLKNEDNIKNEENVKNEDDLKNEENLKNEDEIKDEDDLKHWLSPPNYFFEVVFIFKIV